MTLSEETIAAYADGELDAERMAQVDAAAATDPDLARRLDAHKALKGRLAATYDPMLEEPVPDALAAMIMASSAAPPAPPPRFGRWASYAAMAACLVVGLAVGRATLQAPLIGDDMTARGRLVATLDEGLASEPSGPVRIGVTFQTATGYCRSFQTPDAAGLACRQDDRWKVEAIAPFQSGGEFRTASSMPPVLAAAIDERMTGDAFDATAERQLRDRHWMP